MLPRKMSLGSGWEAAADRSPFPFCAVALILSYLSDDLGKLAAWIAGDDWP
jgi:hypothetical protein